MILLDTHVALWIATSAPIGRRTRALVEHARDDGQLAISAVSFWEMTLLIVKRRFESAKSPASLRLEMLEAGVVELPLTGSIAIHAVELDGLNGDPADRFIAATAIAHDATLITADTRLLKWRHGTKRHNAMK